MAAAEPVGAPRWRKSSHSGTGNCVEVAFTDGHEVYMRDSKQPDGAVLRFTSEEWRTFVAGVHGREFDT